MINLDSCGSLSYLLIIVFLTFVAPKADGQINSYAKVTAISGTTLTLSNVNQTYHTFAAGEQIVIMQMQDDVIGSNTSNNSSFGSLSSISSAGVYEFATINSASGMPTSLTITKSTLYTYHFSANTSVQIISLNKLSAGNYTTTANISGLAWNGSVGGVVAFQVGGTLTLANSISADGLGFRGGSVSSNYYVTCQPNVYDTSSNNYAYKGEGIYSSPTINYTNQTGRAPMLNGGGGGSDFNGGGGGGGNFTAGGEAGPGWSCTATPTGGLGGISLGGYVTGYNRIFMGGGGGGGQQNNSVATAGTSGGGIIIMVGNSLTTSCTGSLKISANGMAAGNSGNDGAGGAGAGGTIALQFNTYNATSGCPLTLQSNGGNGGNVEPADSHSGGGGGGQGAVVYSGAPPGMNMTTTTTNGSGGLNSSSAGATRAGDGAGTANTGVLSTTIALPINFLAFNAFKNGNEAQLDWSIGTSSQIVTFNIQRSTDGASFNTIASMNNSDATDNDYSFTDKNPEDGNNYYRIEEIDFAGNKIYSSIAVVNMNALTNSFAVYPNPSDGNFSIKLNETGNFALSVDDIAGKNVYTNNYQESGNIISVRIDRNLAPGVYLIRLKGNGRTQIGKIIIK